MGVGVVDDIAAKKVAMAPGNETPSRAARSANTMRYNTLGKNTSKIEGRETNGAGYSLGSSS